MMVIASSLFLGVLFLSDTATRLEFSAVQNATPQRDKGQAIGLSILEGTPSRGNAQARIVVAEFSDFQCPFCREAFLILKEVLPRYKDDIYFQYRHFPLTPVHREAEEAAQASMCAHEQGKFWEYHDILFENQDSLAQKPWSDLGRQIGLNNIEFEECLKSGKYKEYIQADYNEGRTLGVSATPTFFINGRKVQGVLPKDVWEQLMKEAR